MLHFVRKTIFPPLQRKEKSSCSHVPFLSSQSMNCDVIFPGSSGNCGRVRKHDSSSRSWVLSHDLEKDTPIIRAAGPWTDRRRKKKCSGTMFFFLTHHGELITTIVSHFTNSKSFQPLSFLEYFQSSTQTCLIAKTRSKSSKRCVRSRILIANRNPRRPQLVGPNDLTSPFRSLLIQNHPHKRSLVPQQRLPRCLPSPNKSRRLPKSKTYAKIFRLWKRPSSRCRQNSMKKKKKSRS